MALKMLYLGVVAMVYAVPLNSQNGAIPSTHAGRKLAEFLSVIESGDEQSMRRFVEGFSEEFLNDIPAEQHLDLFQQMHEQFGRFNVWRLDSSSDFVVKVLLQTGREDKWRSMMIETERSTPHRVSMIDYRPARAPAGAPTPPKMSEAELVSELNSFIDGLVRNDRFSGTVLLAKDGKPLFRKAYGVADREKKIPNRIDTKFNLGSCNKMFTAVAIAQLAERGRLSFEDPIIKHLPDYPNVEAAQKVTIHHLLTHTSGLGSYPFAHGQKNPKGLLQFFADKPLAFEPGEEMQYSNAGFVVLGLIIERISGQSYYDYIRSNIYKPAGMAHTDSYPLDEVVANRAIGYTRDATEGQPRLTERRPNYPGIEIKGSPAGGGYSTVDDLMRFAQALRTHKLLGPKYTEILLIGKERMGPDVMYGYGFGIREVNGERVVGHNGGGPGMNAEFKVYLQTGYTIAVLSNFDPSYATLVSDRIAELLGRLQESSPSDR